MCLRLNIESDWEQPSFRLGSQNIHCSRLHSVIDYKRQCLHKRRIKLHLKKKSDTTFVSTWCMYVRVCMRRYREIFSWRISFTICFRLFQRLNKRAIVSKKNMLFKFINNRMLLTFGFSKPNTFQQLQV